LTGNIATGMDVAFQLSLDKDSIIANKIKKAGSKQEIELSRNIYL